MIFRAYSSVTLKENNSFTELFHKKLLNPLDHHSAKYRLTYAVKMSVRGKPLPEDIANVIKNDPEESATYAFNVKAHGKPVDEEYVKALSKDSHKSQWYASLLFDLGEPVPEYLLNAIAKNPSTSMLLANNLTSTYRIVRLASVDGGTIEIKRNKALPIPDIILQTIIKDPVDAYRLLSLMVKGKKTKIPKILLQSAKKLPGVEMEFKKYLNKKNQKKKG